jgi:DNA polymerase I-like protein with 3'-5' exonuclease and polymerase domains
MSKFIIDIEANGLFKEATRIHCIALRNIEDNSVEVYTNDFNICPLASGSLEDFKCKEISTLIGHNIINYDLPVIEKIIGKRFKEIEVIDTLLLSNLFYPDIYETKPISSYDREQYKIKGGHSLKAWGIRLREFKGEFTGSFEVPSEDMIEYCIQDTNVTLKLYEYLMENKGCFVTSELPIKLEHDIAPIVTRQVHRGVVFNENKAIDLLTEIDAKIFKMRSELRDQFKTRAISLGEFTPKLDRPLYGYRKGCTFTKIKFEEFNPGSRKQVADRLQKELGWEPEEFTEAGIAKLDEKILSTLPLPGVELLKEYYLAQNISGKLWTGENSWLKSLKNGRIYGQVVQNGTVTGRFTHNRPNLGQIPSEKNIYGKQCRALFEASPGMVLFGCDADALELRCLAGYLAKYDNGEFVKTVLYGSKETKTDVHTLNAEAYGVPGDRDCAKTLFYAMLYGAQAPKMGEILHRFGYDFDDFVSNMDSEVFKIKKWAVSKGIDRPEMWYKFVAAGKVLKQNYGNQIPALDELKSGILTAVKERGFLKAIDGRKLKVRSDHAALNMLLQSCGALIMKKALYIADSDLQKEGLTPGIDYEFVLNIHDEFQIEVLDNSSVRSIISNIVPDSIRKAGEFFNFKCPMKGDGKFGSNWSETH